jgi:hypothetical protein
MAQYLPFVFYGVANPEGEHFTTTTTYLDTMQIESLIKQLGTKWIPVHIEHVTFNNQTGERVLPSGRTIAAKLDPETKGIGVYFMLYNTPNGKYALDAMTKGSLTQGQLLWELSLGYAVERLVDHPVILSNVILEVSIVMKGNRNDTKIKGFVSLSDRDNPVMFVDNQNTN